MTTPPAPPPAAQTREPGWYHVRPIDRGGPWWCCEWNGSQWDDRWSDDYAEVNWEIGPRIPTPAERPALEGDGFANGVEAAAELVKNLQAPFHYDEIASLIRSINAKRPQDRYFLPGHKRAAPAERPGDAALAERLRALTSALINLNAAVDIMWNDGTRHHHLESHYKRITAAQHDAKNALDASAANLAALSPAPRDGGWNEPDDATVERVANAAFAEWYGEDVLGEMKAHRRNEWYAVARAAIRALARPLPAQPTEDGR